MKRLVLACCLIVVIAGCAERRKKSLAERHLESLQQQGYGFGNEANANAHREKIRNR